MHTKDSALLAAALVGYEVQLKEIDVRVAELRKQLGSTARTGTATPKHGPISAAGRRRIGDATRKRWAAYRAAKKKAA